MTTLNKNVKKLEKRLENVKQVSEMVTQDVKQLLSETLYRSDFPELDTSITTRKQA